MLSVFVVFKRVFLKYGWCSKFKLDELTYHGLPVFWKELSKIKVKASFRRRKIKYSTSQELKAYSTDSRCEHNLVSCKPNEENWLRIFKNWQDEKKVQISNVIDVLSISGYYKQNQVIFLKGFLISFHVLNKWMRQYIELHRVVICCLEVASMERKLLILSLFLVTKSWGLLAQGQEHKDLCSQDGKR